MARRLMTDHKLDAACGYFSPHAVTRRAPFNAAALAAISGNIAYRGRCVHLNDSEEWIFGVAADKVAHWIFSSSNDTDVSIDGGDPDADRLPFTSGLGGLMLALSSTGAYELRTTEFDDTQTYIVNQPLTAALGTTLATAGVMTNQGATYANGVVCGVVSRNRSPAVRDKAGMRQLYFYPGFFPFNTLA